MKNQDQYYLNKQITSLRAHAKRRNEEVWKLKQHISFLEQINKRLSDELEKSKAQEKEPSKSWSFSLFGCELSLTICKD
jgi:high-affinity Fe2+/Pb2+ permease